jgi:hypothetical protein
LFFSIGVINFANLAVLALANMSMIRYNFTLHFVYYLMPVFIPLFIGEWNFRKKKVVDKPIKNDITRSKIAVNKKVKKRKHWT